MTYGSATDAGGVPDYLRSVHGGREPAPDLVAEFQRRYGLIGRSPLVDITAKQAEALQRALDEKFEAGTFLVDIGMLHSAPRIDEAIGRLTEKGVNSVLAITLAPQFSPIILSGYQRALDRVAASRNIGITLAGAWHRQPALIGSLADRLLAALEAFPLPPIE